MHVSSLMLAERPSARCVGVLTQTNEVPVSMVFVSQPWAAESKEGLGEIYSVIDRAL